MNTLVALVKHYMCMRRQEQHPPPLLDADDDQDLEMQPLFCEEPGDTSPAGSVEPAIGPVGEDREALADEEEGGVVHVQQYQCTPVMFQAVESAPKLHVKLLRRVRARLPRRTDLFMALNPDLLESNAWRLRANDLSKEMSSIFERHDVLRTWGYTDEDRGP
jgi:hypothetical protein